MQPVDKSRRLTMEEKSRMYDALAEPGSSVTDVAQKFGVSYTTAWKWNEKFNNGLSKADFMQPGDSTRRLSMEEQCKLWEALSVPGVKSHRDGAGIQSKPGNGLEVEREDQGRGFEEGLFGAAPEGFIHETHDRGEEQAMGQALRAWRDRRRGRTEVRHPFLSGCPLLV